MQKKKKSALNLGSIVRIAMVLPSLFRMMGSITRLIRDELKLACRSIITLILLAFVFFSLLFSSWICLGAMLCLYLVSLSFGWIASIAIVLGVNIVMLSIVLAIIYKTKKNDFFPATKSLIADQID